MPGASSTSHGLPGRAVCPGRLLETRQTVPHGNAYAKPSDHPGIPSWNAVVRARLSRDRLCSDEEWRCLRDVLKGTWRERSITLRNRRPEGLRIRGRRERLNRARPSRPRNGPNGQRCSPRRPRQQRLSCSVRAAIVRSCTDRRSSAGSSRSSDGIISTVGSVARTCIAIAREHFARRRERVRHPCGHAPVVTPAPGGR
jgi:hypothetical protein